MVQIYIKTAGNMRFFISCIKFHKIFTESFNEISLIPRSVNNSNSYWFGFWQIDFREKKFNVIMKQIILCIIRVVSNRAGHPTPISILVTT